MTSQAPLWPTVQQLRAPRSGELHIFAVNIAAARERQQRLMPGFSADEVDRAARYRISAPRDRFVAARAALRAILSACLDVEAERVVFAYDAYGKPALNASEHSLPLTFNVSHSGDLALIAVTRSAEVGIDVECGRRVRYRTEIAERFFHPQEVARINELSVDEREAAFFRCWTRKEAIVKAIGTGLQYPLDAFCVPVSEQVADWIPLPAHVAHPAQQCWLQNLDPCLGYAAAVATVGSQPICQTAAFEL